MVAGLALPDCICDRFPARLMLLVSTLYSPMRSLRAVLVVLASILVLDAVPAEAQQGTRGVIPQRNTQQRVVGKRRALIVGVDEYQDRRIPQLRYATVDAMAFVGWLRSPASAASIDTMVILLNREATRERVMDTYRELVGMTQENDELIFYFAGHGGVREVHNSMEGYLFPHDADSTNIARRGISLDDINKEVSYLPGQSPVLLILDACRSGNLFGSNQMSRAAANLGPNVRRIVSSSGNQDSQEGDRWEGHGAFTYFLLNGLYGMADADQSGNVTLAELGLWVVSQVSRETNDAQVPEVQPFDHKWGITAVVPSLRDSVARRVAARPGSGNAGAVPTRGVGSPPPASTSTPTPRPGSTRPGNTVPPANSPAPPPSQPAPSAPRPAARRGGAIRVGERVQGELVAASPILGDSTRFDAWTFSGKRGDRLAITMRSSSFDPFLILARNSGGSVQNVRQDDDGGGGTDARIAIELPSDGDYTIVANAVQKTALGAYTLSLESVNRVQISFRDVVANAAQHPVIRIGSTTNGTLGPQSALLTDGSSFDAYTFEGRAGETVEISMETTNFDAFLALGILGTDSVVAKDDDSGVNSNALIVARLPRTGRYVVLANSYGRDAAGSYSLGVRAGLPPVATTTIFGRAAGTQRVRLGQTVTGNLATATEAMPDASPFQVWYFEGRAGQRITVNMRSADFDNFLHIGRVGAKQALATDDDAGGGTNARLSVTLPEAGLYAIIANSLRPNGRGEYTLEVRDGSSIDWKAMTNRDVLAVADSFPRIQMGQTARGRLSNESPVRTDETPFAGYVFEGRRGETVQIDMEAGFDAFLSVGRAGTDSILGNDDDGGDGTNSRLSFTVPVNGRYVILANAIGKDARGDFTLRLSAGRAAATLTQILGRTPSPAQTIRAGQPVNGRLSDADPVMADRSAFATWFYEGRAGEQITVTMRSSDFDAYLHIGHQGGSATIATDDDGGGGTHAQLNVTLPRDGLYVIVANMLSSGNSGAYTLELTSRSASAGPTTNLQPGGGKGLGRPSAGAGSAAANAPVSSAAPSTSAAGSRLAPAAVLAMPTSSNRVLRLGQTVTGSLNASSATLSDNSPFDAWYFEGRAGERVTITLRSSDFDAYLHVGRQGDRAVLGNDDDSGGNTDAQLTVTLPSTGTYVILANTFAAGSSGTYRLELSAARGADESSK